ncbi:hypothetical protein BH10BAC1_BH10BAC1_17190 [soil metagenome]
MKFIMKSFSCFLSVIIFTTGLNAQKSTVVCKQVLNHASIVNGLMQNQLINASQSKMVAIERVIAQSTYDNTFSSKSDSVKLNYVLNGASTYDYNMMLYAYNYPYATSPMFNYLGTFTKPPIEYNSYSHWTINPNTLVYGFYEKDQVGYDVNRNLIRDTALFADSAIYPNMTYINKFNAANNVDTSYSFVYNAGISNNAFKQFFSYNASNKVTKDSIYEYDSGSWYLVSKTFYTYDVSNNLIQIDNFSNNTDTTFTLPLVEQLKYVNTYDASNRLKTVNSSYYDGTALTPSVIDSFAYSGSYAFHLSWKEYQYDAINSYWAPMTYMTKTLNGFGLPDVINIKTFDSLANAWVPSVKQMAYYNTSNNPIKLDEYIYNFTSFPSTPDFTTNYYYESYTNTTEIHSSNISFEFNVYPNPTSHSFIITGNEKIGHPISIKLVDATGKTQKKQVYRSANDSIEISVEDLSVGIYFLIIEDLQENILSKRTIIKVD